MAFYQLSKEERQSLVQQIHSMILSALQNDNDQQLKKYCADEDTYIRKTTYLVIGRIYQSCSTLQEVIMDQLNNLSEHANEKVRQTAVNAAGEIGRINFPVIENLMRKALFDAHHCVRNAVIGAIKKMGEKNPVPVLAFAQRFLHHEDKEIRREICHGIELRGRTHPQDALPLLQELEHDKTARVRNTLIHVLGQISYKQGCLATVVAHLKSWKNQELVSKALEEIIDVHERYKDFAALTQEQAKAYIRNHI